MRWRAIESIEGTESELQPRLAGAVCQSLDATVEAVAATVEHTRLGPGVLGALREQLARALCLFHPREGLQVALGPVDRRDGTAADVVDQLRLHAAVGAEHRQPR